LRGGVVTGETSGKLDNIHDYHRLAQTTLFG
jgi:hypothetical protein